MNGFMINTIVSLVFVAVAIYSIVKRGLSSGNFIVLSIASVRLLQGLVYPFSVGIFVPLIALLMSGFFLWEQCIKKKSWGQIWYFIIFFIAAISSLNFKELFFRA